MSEAILIACIVAVLALLFFHVVRFDGRLKVLEGKTNLERSELVALKLRVTQLEIGRRR